VQNLTQQRAELLVAGWIGCDHIERAVERFVAEQKDDSVHHIVDVYPRHILLTVAKWAAETRAERQRHLGQCATFWRQHHAGTQ